MAKRLATFGVCLAALFLLINRPAYKAFFTDDDFDNLANAQEVDLAGLAQTLVNPNTTGEGQFRAVPYLYYYAMVRAAGLHYAPYIAGIHVIHLLNVLLVWLLARALGAEILGACAAALFYAFHAAAFDIYWKAMYAFDLLCATCVLASLWSYVRGRVILSVVFFWLSIKCKEVAIFFPFVLAGYEMLLSGRGLKGSWRRLLPFFAIAALVGGLAMRANVGRDDDYSLRFNWAAVGECVRYYSSQVALIPYAGLALVAVPFVARSRRVWFGLLTFVLFLGPMLFLPGRLFAAYLYVPMIGLAIALSAATRWTWLAAFFLLWIPWNYQRFRVERREAQTIAEQRRHWFTPVEALVRAHPEIDTFVYDGTPDSMPNHAIAGAVRLLRPGRETRTVALPQGGWDVLQNVNDATHLAVLVWDEPRMRLHVMARKPDAAYISLDEEAPLWQLTSGWVGNQGHMRWMRPQATVRLHRPAGARELELVVDVVLRGLAERSLAVSVDGVDVGNIRFTRAGVTTFRLPVAAAGEGTAMVEFRASPAMPDPAGDGELGQPIGSVGFRE